MNKDYRNKAAFCAAMLCNGLNNCVATRLEIAVKLPAIFHQTGYRENVELLHLSGIR